MKLPVLPVTLWNGCTWLPCTSTTFHASRASASVPSSGSVADPASCTGTPSRYFAPSSGAVSVTTGGALLTEIRTVAVELAFLESVTFSRASKLPPFV